MHDCASIPDSISKQTSIPTTFCMVPTSDAFSRVIFTLTSRTCTIVKNSGTGIYSVRVIRLYNIVFV